MIEHPFRSGFPAVETGTIRIGLSRAYADATFRSGLFGLLALAGVTGLLGLLGLFAASRRIAAPVEELGRDLSALLEHTPLAICVQSSDGRIGRYSAQFEELFGSNRSLVGTRLRDVVAEAEADRLRDDERELFSGAIDIVRRDANLVADAEQREFALTRFRLGRPGPEARVVTLALDVTEHRKLEEALIQSRKMESIGQFAGGVAHDFNNLLTGISSAADLIELADGDPAVIAGHCAQLRTITEMASGLTGRLLSFGRKQITVVAPHDLNRIASDLEGFVARLLREDVHLTVDLADDVLAARVDRGQIDQVLMNLLGNARDAMEPGGTVTLRTGRRTLADKRVVGKDILEPGNYAVLEVDDEGGGIPDSIQSSLFDPFATTKDLGSGTGLGLSIVYGIVTRHGGAIEFESRAGDGTTFRVWLPTIDSAELPTQPVEQATPKPSPRRLRVLVVEDNTFVRTSVVAALRRLEHEALGAEDGETGLSMFAAHDGAFDVVLVDVLMPGINGPEVGAAIRERAPNLPILFMTGYDDELLQDTMDGDSNSAWIQKPFTLASLTDRLERFVG